MSKLTDFVKSLTSNRANTDSSPGARVPPIDDGAVPMKRKPQAGFEPERRDD